MTRRDKCFLTGKRAARLPHEESAKAWKHLAIYLESLGDKDLPKFNDLLHAIRTATIKAKSDVTH